MAAAEVSGLASSASAAAAPGSAGFPEAAPLVQHTEPTRKGFQDYGNFLNYCSAGQWRLLLQGNVPQVEKLTLLARHLACLGCRFPSEQTSQVLTALLLALPGSMTPGKDASDIEKYQSYLVVKDQLVRACRDTRASGPPVLPAVPGELANDLLDAALQGEPVAVCPFNSADLRLYAQSIPMRCTHRSLANKKEADNVLGTLLNTLHQTLNAQDKLNLRVCSGRQQADERVETALQLPRASFVPVPQPKAVADVEHRVAQLHRDLEDLDTEFVPQLSLPPLSRGPSAAAVQLSLQDRLEAPGKEQVLDAAVLLAEAYNSQPKRAAGAAGPHVSETAGSPPPPKLRRKVTGKTSLDELLLQGVTVAPAPSTSVKTKALQEKTKPVPRRAAALGTKKVQKPPQKQAPKSTATQMKTKRKSQKKGRFSDLSEKQRFRLFPNGCSRCRFTAGCARSCLIRLGYQLIA